jgi:hypothetical protein
MRRLRVLHPLRERDFALFQTGSIVSLIGDGLFMVAIAWQVYDIWNVPTAFAIVGVAETVPLVVLPTDVVNAADRRFAPERAVRPLPVVEADEA